MDTILSQFPQAHAFIDDILVVTKGTEIEHISAVEKILRKLDRGNMSLKLTKYQFARKECEWLMSVQGEQPEAETSSKED